MTALNIVLEMGPHPTFSLFDMDPLRNNVLFCWSSFSLFTNLSNRERLHSPHSSSLDLSSQKSVTYSLGSSGIYLFIVPSHRQAFGIVVQLLIPLKLCDLVDKPTRTT